MKQCFTNKCGLALVLLLFAFVQGAWAQKQKPTITFTSTEKNFNSETSTYTVLISEKSFHKPTVSLKIGERNMRRYFSLRYSLDQTENVKSDSTDNDGHTVYKDTKTGTTVNNFTGDVNIGSNATASGAPVKIKVTATPTALASSDYEANSADYYIVINTPAASAYTVTVPNIQTSETDKTQSISGALTLVSTKKNGQINSSTDTIYIKGITLKYLASTGDYDIDVTKDFDVEITDATEGANANKLTFADVKDKKGNIIGKIIGSKFEATSKTTINQPVKLTFTPKEGKKAQYGEGTSISYTININTTYYPADGTDKIKTYLVFPKHEAGWYRGWYKYDPQDPKVYDENGNDVTSSYNLGTGWNVTPMNSFKYSDNPFDKGYNFWNEDHTKQYAAIYTDYTEENKNGLQIYGKDDGMTNRPDDYIVSCLPTLNSSSPLSGILAETPIVEGKNNETYKVKGQFYNQNHENAANIKPGQYVVHVYKVAPNIVLTPDPSTVRVAANYEMNKGNRFSMKGEFYDQYRNFNDSTIPGNDSYRGFTYSMFVPNKYVYDETVDGKNGANLAAGTVHIEVIDRQTKYEGATPRIVDNVLIYTKDDGDHKKGDLNENGKAMEENVIPHIKMHVPTFDENGDTIFDATTHDPVFEEVEGTLYLSKSGWGNDNTVVIFHGKGHVPLYYNAVPWNHATWDLSGFSGKMFNVVEHQPTVLVINPQKFVIRKGDTAEPPTVKVWDRDFNIELTKYFDYEWTKQEDSQNIITFDATTHKSTGNEVGGPISINVKATAKTDVNDDVYSAGMYDDPTSNPGVYTVQVINNRTLFDVIYDESYYQKDGTSLGDDENNKPIPGEYDNTTTTKMGKLHFVDDATTEADKITSSGIEFTPGQQSINQAPGLNVTFGAPSDEMKWMVIDASGDGHTATDKLFDDYTSTTPSEAGERVIDIVSGPTEFAKSNTETDPDNMTNIFGENGCYTPVAGGFLKLQPTTNGFLQIDANFGDKNNPVTYTLIDAAAKNQDAERDIVSRPATTDEGVYYGERRFPYALLEGHTYYLFSDAGTFQIHGLTFMPAFVVMHEDKEPVRTATVFANSPWIGDLPTLVNEDRTTKSGNAAASDVNFTETFTDWKKQKNIKQLGTTGSETKNASDLVTVQNGYQIVGKGFTFENRVRVRGSVIGSSVKYNDKVVERAPYIDIASSGIPIYKVSNTHEGVMPGTRVTTTNFVTRMWMTWGGWEQDDQGKYPYNRINKGAYEEFTDAWNNAKSDTVGRDNMTIDGFKYASGADNNAYDENVKLFNAYGVRGYFSSKDQEGSNGLNGGNKFKHIKVDPFNVPVRGGYVKFEPGESGTLMIYVLQNGMTDLDNNRPTEHLNSSPQEFRRRSLYIVDEKGKVVQLNDNNDNWTGSESYGTAVSNEGHHSEHMNYMTEGLLRCTWGKHTANGVEIPANPTGKDMTMVASRWADEYPLGEKDPGYTADKSAIEKAWMDKPMNSQLEVIKLSDGSFAVPTKAYVRYTFPVKSGKTYYVFMNGSKLAFCGFAFVPVGFMSHASSWPECKANGYGLTEEDSTARASLPEPSNDIYSPEQSTSAGYKDVALNEKKEDGKKNSVVVEGDVATNNVEFVNVKVDRSFKNKEWSSICLPFSVNQTQMKELFGNDYSLITFDSVMTKHTEESRVYSSYDPNDDINGDSIGVRKLNVEARTAHFTKHVNQDLIGGKPYFIYPSWTDDQLAAFSDDEKYTVNESVVGRKNITFKHVSFEAQPALTDSCWNYKVWYYNDTVAAKGTAEAKKAAKKQIFTYRFTGIYDRAQIPWYSYIMGTQNDKNGLYRVTPSAGNTASANKPYLKGFRAYLAPLSTDIDGDTLINDDGTTHLAETGKTTPAKIDLSDLWITGADIYGNAGKGTATGIDQLVEEMNTMLTVGRKGVYNLQGQLVRMENNINGLPAGVYIMNGKKYLVK